MGTIRSRDFGLAFYSWISQHVGSFASSRIESLSIPGALGLTFGRVVSYDHLLIPPYIASFGGP
jgi:hypothetical protein